MVLEHENGSTGTEFDRHVHLPLRIRRPCFKALLIHKLAWLFRPLLLYIQEHVAVQVIPVPLVDSHTSGQPIYSHPNIRVNKDEFNMPGNHIGPITVSAVPIHGPHCGQEMELLKQWYWRRHKDQSISVKPQLDFLPWRSGNLVNRIDPPIAFAESITERTIDE